MTSGIVFDIKTFAIHDGPGIRTTVFLKGCPLRCLWCQNPEGLEIQPQIWHFPAKCIGCKQCEAVCPHNAIEVGTEHWINRELCCRCGLCADTCVTNSLAFDSKEMTVDEVTGRVLEDVVFYRNSHGGVTLSGGEATFQYSFSLALLQEFKRKNLHTAIESCMHCSPDVWKQFFPLIDKFIVDLKCMDSNQHKAFTGMDNHMILENFRILAENKEDILVRIPMIPGMTATHENVAAISSFVYSIRKTIPVELINYNPLAPGKYRIMGKQYCLDSDCNPLSRARLAELEEVVRDCGLQVVSQNEV